MEKLFEDSFNPNNRSHVKWLKDLVNFNDGALANNPFGIYVSKLDTKLYPDIVNKLSRKFINSSVCYNFGELFSYEYAYHMDGEYQKCRLLRDFEDYPKGTYFEYALVYPTSIDFYKSNNDDEPDMKIERF
jgi:hypothetical protein